jgi:hypothetical protein
MGLGLHELCSPLLKENIMIPTDFAGRRNRKKKFNNCRLICFILRLCVPQTFPLLVGREASLLISVYIPTASPSRILRLFSLPSV